MGDASTHGKGTVQSLSPLKPFLKQSTETLTNDPGTLKMTIRKFYRASGQSTQLKGVTPDLVLPSVNNVAEVGETALENPLPWDTIESAKFERLNRMEPYLAELRKRELERLAHEKDSDYVREDIDLAKKILADKTVSLNEKQRRKEKEEADAREKGRQKERLARAPLDKTVYEITLKLADQPGLPPPVPKTNTLVAAKDTSAEATSTSTSNTAASDFSKGTTNTLVAVRNATAPNKSRGRTRVAMPTIAVTNSVSVATFGAPGSTAFGSADSIEEEKPPPADFALEEAEHILVDYLSLLPKEAVVTVNDSSARH